MEAPQSYKLARRADPQTSKDAAKSIVESAVSQQMAILDVLDTCCGFLIGASFIGTRMGIDPHRVRRRLPELQTQGLAEPTGHLLDSYSGRKERAWRITQAGIDALEAAP